MTTMNRHQYAAANNLTIITDDNNEFWAMDDKGNGDGFGITLREGNYIARFCNADGKTITTAACYGDSMDEALANLLS